MFCLRRLGISNFTYVFRYFSTETVVVDRIEGVTTIGLNVPHKRNCLSLAVIERLKRAFDDFDRSDSSTAVLYGEGGNFCSGFDLDEISKIGLEPFRNATKDWTSGFLSKKPVICAVDGFCVAEGFELALACDFRVIEDTAQLGFLGRRFGIPLNIGGGPRLSSSVGRSRALDLIITGRLINGNAAHEWGLASLMVATGTALGQSTNLGFSLIKLPAYSIEYDRINSQVFASHDENYVRELENAVFSEIPKNIQKFYQGIGKHGKFKNIAKRDLLHWENDDLYIKDASKTK